MDGIAVVRNILTKLQNTTPSQLLAMTEDFFGNQLHEKVVDKVLITLMKPPRDKALFEGMIKACFEAIEGVIQRQYEKYFDINVTQQLIQETESARTHNIDAEEIMEMFGPLQKKAPNATICYLSCKMRAKKNRTVEYLDKMDEERRNKIVKKAVHIGKEQRIKRKMEKKDLKKELLKRRIEKQQAREATERRKVERKLKDTGVDKLEEEFADVGAERLEVLVELMKGKAVGREIYRVWQDDAGESVVYNGRIEKLKRDGKTYEIGYWQEPTESYDNAVDYHVSMYELGADLLNDDLELL